MPIDEQHFARALKSRGKRPTTIEQYLRYLRKIPNNILKDPAEVNLYFDRGAWTREGLTESVRYAATTAVRAYYKFILKRKDLAELIEKDPYTPGQCKDYLTPEQIRLIRGVCNEDELLIFDTTVYLALRRSMVLNLTPSLFDFQKKRVTIPASMEGNKSKITWPVDVPLPLLERYEQYIVERGIGRDRPVFKLYFKGHVGRPRRDEAPERWKINPDDLNGYHLYANQKDALTKLFKSIGERVGIKLWPHLAKHTKGTHFYKANRDMKKTKDALLQKTFTATEVYVHAVETLEKANEKYLQEIGL